MAESPRSSEALSKMSSADNRVINDRYQVVRVLGSGSSGRTLLCMDLEDRRHVAVKELHFQYAADWKHLELFEREAKTLAMLDHSGIPKVFAFFRESGESTTYYIVQEFIEGLSLQQRMQSGPMLGQSEIVGLTLEVLDILDYLHGRAPPIVHRDIKPSNVLLRTDGSPVLLDFGGVSVAWRPPETEGTTVVGTFGYMPPEQLMGQVGPTSDLYALGATLLHLVTGRKPSEFPFDSGRIEVPDNLPIDGALVRLIEALLRPAPRDRPRNASAARQILLGTTALDVATVALPDQSVAARSSSRTVVHQRRYAVGPDTGPRFVDMGEPPRDPHGEFSDVYRNLIHPLFPARLLWSHGVHMLWLGLSTVVSVASVGVVPAIYYAGVRKRKKQYEALSRSGAFTRGTIQGFQKDDAGAHATFRYEFDVGDATYVAYIDYAQEMSRYWNQGDVVPVLYDPDDPSRCCFVYR